VSKHHLSTRVLVVDPSHPERSALDDAVEVLLGGGLVAFAAETVYGLAAVATDAQAVQRLFAAKGRPTINPLIVHVADVAQARQCVEDWPGAADVLARAFWPGPLTLVLARAKLIPDPVTAGKETVAVRVPSSQVALGLIERSGKPLAAPSANRSNRVSPTRAEHVLADLGGRIDLILDSGPTRIGLESTVLDMTTTPPRILRPGPISAAALEAALGGERVQAPTRAESTDRPASPGQMPRHYAPVTVSKRVDSCAELERIALLEQAAVIVLGRHDPGPSARAGHRFVLETPEEAARSLYDVLRRCDALGVVSILIVMPPDEADWQAVRDRLLRATRPIGGAE
jgi:L-threonylcarbamoyladenylate synthase